MRARERIDSLTPSFDEKDAKVRTTDPLRFEGYGDQLERARQDTDLVEACVWGWAEIGGVRCALVVFDFAFMGGSMGMVVGEKVARAFDAARRARVPAVTVTASGGARMQEGMWSLVQMGKTVEARRRHRAAGLAHITYLTTPTTGGVYASFASLADVVFAEPEATVGFAGPRVVQQLTGEAPPSDVHTAESAFAHGLVDAIVASDDAPDAIGRALRSLSIPTSKPAPVETPGGSVPPSSLRAWDRLQATRDAGRTKGGDLVRALLDDAVELRGDRTGAADDEHVVVRIGRLASGRSVAGIAQHATGDGRIRPQGFRKATRAAGTAGRLGLPVLTVIDTRGADPLPDSEVGGVAAAIAGTFEALLDCPSPTLAVLIGEGGSGGALAMATCDRVIAVADAVFSVIAPEGAAAILYRDAGRAPELAERLGIGVESLSELGLVDVVVAPTVPGPGIPGSPGGVAKGQVNAHVLSQAIASELDGLAEARRGRRLAARSRRWRSAGLPSNNRRRGRLS